MQTSTRYPVPTIYAALGGVAAYYGLPPFRGTFPRWPSAVLGLIILSVFLVSLFRVLAFLPVLGAHRRYRPLGRAVLAFSAGLCLGMAASIPRSLALGLPGDQITGFSGRLVEDPRAFPDGRGMGSLALGSVRGRGGLRASAKGTAPVFFPVEAIPRIRDFGRGAELYLEGSLVEGNRGMFIRATGVHIVRSAPALEQLRTSLRLAILEKLVPDGGPSWGPLAAALILGVRDNLDTELARSFQAAGCSHILALSGMHLAIISALIAFLLRKPLGIRTAALTGGLLISAYAYLAGGQPSLVRATIMYLLGVLALLGNLKARPLSFLALAFLIQICFQPESGASFSFILSYLALGGILLTGEWTYQLLRGRLPGVLAQGFSASLGASLATAAVAAMAFGVQRPVGILAGLLLMPLASVFMAASLGNLLLCFIFPSLAVFLGKGLSLLVDLQSALVSLAARVPGIVTPRPLPVLLVSLGLSLAAWYGARQRLAQRNSLAPFD